MISEAIAKQRRLNGLAKTVRSSVRSYVQFTGTRQGYQRRTTKYYSNSLEVVWLCRSLLKIERAIVDRHLPQNEDPPKPLPKTVHELDARFDDSKSNRSLGFEPN
jgi:hypothetical protein